MKKEGGGEREREGGREIYVYRFASLSAALKQGQRKQSKRCDAMPCRLLLLLLLLLLILPHARLVYIAMTIKANDEWHVENND